MEQTTAIIITGIILIALAITYNVLENSGYFTKWWKKFKGQTKEESK